MSDAEEVKLSLKVMINKEKTKVLFAEADSHFTDVLLSFLSLPLARIVKLLENHYGDKAPILGSLTTLYKGLANLDDVHFCTEGAKLMLLNPTSSLDTQCCKLKLDISGSQPTNYFICDDFWCDYPRYEKICMYYGGTERCVCGKKFNRKATISDYQDADADGGVFTINTASFIICDDLRMVPYSTGFIQTLRNLGIKGVDGAELRNLTFGFDEIMDLLMCTLLSKTPLTDLILNNGQIMCSSAAKPEARLLLHQIKKEETSKSNKVILKVMVQKSTNKLLFAQAEEDFIELLCSFLITPIGGVESLLDSDTSLNNIDNLYKSLSNVIHDKYLKTPDTKKRLLKPKLPHGYISENLLLPLDEETAPELYYTAGERGRLGTFSHYQLPKYDSMVWSLKSPKGEGNFVKEPTTYMVTDDLTVTPFCMSSTFSILSRMNIPVSDVDELEVRIGLQEALSLLKASLTSTSALSDGLLNCVTMKKQPK